MAQSGSFFGHRRGSTKTLTFQTRSGKQITQDRKSGMKNAKSVPQVEHRCLLHTCVDACTWLAPRFNFAWEGAKGRESYQNAFRKANYKLVRAAALGGMAGWTFSPYQVTTVPMGYYQVSDGSLPYKGHCFMNGLNGVDYTETDFLNYTAEGEQWLDVIAKMGLKVGDKLLLSILFLPQGQDSVSRSVVEITINDVPDVVVGQQAANSLLTVNFIINSHGWTVVDNPTRILSLRVDHATFDPSAMIMCTACFQTRKRQGKTLYSPGFLWHWGDNVDGLHFDAALQTYPSADRQQLPTIPVDDDLWVDLGLPSGTLWATRNLDAAQKNGFAASPYQYECSFFSFGNTDGHNPTGDETFAPWNWGNSVTDEPYASSDGATIGNNTTLPAKYDAATNLLGNNIKTPTLQHYIELQNGTVFVDAQGNEIDQSKINKIIIYKGISCIRLKSKYNNNTIIFPTCGNGVGTAWNSKNTVYMMSSSSGNAGFCYILQAYQSYLSFQRQYNRAAGFSIRPIMIPSKRGKTNPDPVKDHPTPTK